MHNFDDLISRSTAFALEALNKLSSKLTEDDETNASTNTVKNLQMIQLQKAIIAIGMFSLFESILQKELECDNGFKEAKTRLSTAGETEILAQFEDFYYAINVLKHGKGASYNALIAKSKSKSLPFRIKLLDEDFFEEGDISEVSTLIEVDDKFVLTCAQLIEQVSKKIRNT